VRVLGQGGFGRVDLCQHKTTGVQVAIKHMRADKIGKYNVNAENAQGIDIIFRETENLKALNHPNIVKILNFYAPKGLDVVFVMEYM
jgi:serine/threonine protein kinase